jgi:hypothetical protein
MDLMDRMAEARALIPSALELYGSGCEDDPPSRRSSR